MALPCPPVRLCPCHGERVRVAPQRAQVATPRPLFYRACMQKYGISVEQLGPHGQAGAQAAERLGARTVIYRDKVAVAAIVPMTDMERVDPVQLGDSGADPLLALCGTCHNDMFVDSMSDLSSTVLFRRQSAAPPAVQAHATQQHATQQHAVQPHHAGAQPAAASTASASTASASTASASTASASTAQAPAARKRPPASPPQVTRA